MGRISTNSLQGGLQDKTEFDHSKQTLALAFEVEPGIFNADLGKFKLCKLKQKWQ
ncbi:hypothetical protein [Wolbachia endosymbiont of Wuchereria bancrofti]|uniref:hypothetical protein n=1 Tax=Wolbachia endosymbiont of Wuchereria bancrofti TaxID=96496 RepID=UPI0015D0856D|nr:hypothetical protein [Wolbachia endosymbiont of Wuchereria bancrofti]